MDKTNIHLTHSILARKALLLATLARDNYHKEARGEPDLEAIAQVATLADACIASATWHPSVIVSDIERREGGIGLVRHLRVSAPVAALIVLTFFGSLPVTGVP